MRRGLLGLAGLVLGLALLGLGQGEIPLPEGAVMRLGTGRISGSVVFSPDGKILASGSYNGTVLLWDLESLIAQPPTVTSLAFPGSVFTRVEAEGTLRFCDPNADLVRAEFTVVEGDRATVPVLPALGFDPEVRGATSGAFRFTVVVTKAQTVVLRLVLVDSAGLRSDPVDLTFRVE